MRGWGKPPALLAAVVVLYLGLGGLYAANTPAWQAPDEPAHYNYVRHVAGTGTLPVLQPGDYDAAYLEELKSERFPPGKPINSIRYEGWQPPLYYVLAAPVFALTGGSLLALRLFSLALGAGVVVLAWGLARAALPRWPVAAVAAAGFVAFVPQHLAMLASVNNDALAEVVIGLGLVLAVRAVQPADAPRPLFWAMGVVLGLGFLTKLSAYPLAALLGLALLLRGWRERWPRLAWARAALAVYGPALLLGALWWGRNLAVYGGLDFLAMVRHDEVVVGQLRTADALAQWGAGGYARSFVQTTFQSFWGQFGWMGVVMDRRVYWALLAYSAVLIVGVVGAWRSCPRPWPPAARAVAVVLAAQVALTVMVYLYYNLTFVQFQGRYLYPALPVLALGAGVGLRQWACWLGGERLWQSLAPSAARAMVSTAAARTRQAALAILPLAALALMAALDVLALYWFVVPQLAP